MIIRRISVSIYRFLQQYLYTEIRLPHTIKLFDVLLHPFSLMMAEYKAWRNEAIIKANITISKGSVEWYLNYLFDTTLQRIYIENNKGGGVIMGIEATETAMYQIMGIEATEPTLYVIMTIDGEDDDMGLSSFGVFVPTALISQADAISGIVNLYTIKDFVIIEF